MCADACVVRLVVAGFRRERLMALVNFCVAFAAFFRYLATKVQNLCAFVCDVGLNLLLSKCFNAYKGQCKRLVACTNAYGLN